MSLKQGSLFHELSQQLELEIKKKVQEKVMERLEITEAKRSDIGVGPEISHLLSLNCLKCSNNEKIIREQV